MKNSIFVALILLVATNLFAASTNEVEVSFKLVTIGSQPDAIVEDFLNYRRIGSTNDIPEVRLSEWARVVVASKLSEEFEEYKSGVKAAAVENFLQSFATSSIPGIVIE